MYKSFGEEKIPISLQSSQTKFFNIVLFFTCHYTTIVVFLQFEVSIFLCWSYFSISKDIDVIHDKLFFIKVVLRSYGTV